ncbi:MAG TPA: LamG-like jellyroll fold domain-containing protein, partial [Verrucomicrobiae bacterium]|nr:LamG-like jellyroll fold domain-containing protein [Verrucomicrobiae bacterium]
MNPNGSQTVNGQPVPMNIPDGSPALPGKGYVFGIAIFPMTVASVTLSDSIWHQNFGDLIGTLTLNGAHPDVLNNHDSLGNPPGPYFLTYDDSAGGGIAGSRPSDGPGTLNNYIGLQGLGVWMLTEVDDSLTQTGAVYSCNLLIQPHQKPTVGVVTNYVPGGSWVYNFIDVPPGATNLTVYATNLTDTANPPVELFVKFGSEPTTNSYDAVVQLTPNGFISLGPPLVSGRYFVGLFNPNPNSAVQTVTLFAVVGIPFTPAQTIYNSTDTPVPILDDAVTTDSIFVTNYALISSLDVALAVQHPRISDLVFHLISPDGTRVLLMENRGGTDPNGAGGVATVTNTISFANFSSGLNLLSLSGSATIISNSVLRLTPALSGQDGRAWLTQKQLCANGFDTTFHFRISGPFGNIFGGEPGGDGINFAVQKVWPTNLVESGIAGAYGTNSVNVFFNTFWNWPGNSNPVIQDLSDNSIGIGVNGLYVAQTDLNPLGINMSDGNVHLAHINYDGSVFNVWVDNVKVLANVPMPGLSPGVDSSGEGWVGFDAFCGAAYENHDILDWTFSNPLQQNNYLVFTENTNLTTTPIKFAAPPFKPGPSTNVVAASGFDSATPGDYYTASFNDGTNVWNVLSNQVSVVNDPANADAGSHFLALANGTVSNTLPTVAGRAYVLTFRYRGPAIDGWWRAESNTVDSIYSNNGTWINGAVYAVGEVGTTFDMNGVNNYVLVNPASSHWNFGQTTGFTIEGWINPSSTSPNSAIVEFERALGTTSGNDVGVDFSINSTGPGAMDGNIKDILGVSHSFYATNGIIIPNVWQHVALTYNKVSGIATCYHNGTNVLQTNLGIFTPETSFTNLLIGGRTTFINPNLVFPGGIDELSMYDRSLSDSEIQAISQKGPAGKFDPTEFGVSPPQSLAEAQVSVNGGAPINVFGDNISWQTETITFKATQNGTPLQITGVEPGMLLDSFSLAQTANDIYYLPEQSLDTYDGKNAHGLWTLEIQDDRAGATNPEPLLQSWQLRFNFVTLGTNIYPAVPLTLPQLPEQTAYPGLLFTVTNAAFGGVPPYSYALTSSVPFGPFPSIDTNGVITWTPSSNNPVPAVYMFTNIVTDISTATATDIFQVLLLPTNSQPAFPGAEGPGGPAIGGRGGDVYHVINVNDGGPGSLRYGITNTYGSRTIIFDVSGTINLQSNLRINDPYLTIAGQTAPGDGITLKGYTTSVQDAHDDVVRFLRCRPGDVNSPAFQDDSFHFVNVTNSIADHISASWSIDEALSTTYSTNV